MEEIVIEKTEWTAPEYSHKDRSIDWFWSVGILAFLGAIVAVWFHGYIFAIFIILSGASLIFFNAREPEMINFSIGTEGFIVKKEKHTWKEIQGFSIKEKSDEEYDKLLLLTSKKFLPVYTIPFPKEIRNVLDESLKKVSKKIELEESRSMAFMDKIGL